MTDKPDRVTERLNSILAEREAGTMDAAGTIEDLVELIEALTTRSQPSEDAVERAAAVIAPHLATRYGPNPDCDDQANAHDAAYRIARAALNAAALPVENGSYFQVMKAANDEIHRLREQVAALTPSEDK